MRARRPSRLRATLAAALVLALAPAVVAAAKVEVVGLFKDRAILVIDGKQRLVRAGETTPEGVKLVSADSEAAVIEQGGVTRRYALGTRIGGSFSGPSVRTVRIWPADDHNTYTVEGSIDGSPVRFLVDTGATTVAINRNEARRLGIDYRHGGTPSLGSTASGVTRTWRLKLDRVKVGDIELRDVDAAVIDGAYPRIALLGMSFLGRLDMRREGAVLELRTKY